MSENRPNTIRPELNRSVAVTLVGTIWNNLKGKDALSPGEMDQLNAMLVLRRALVKKQPAPKKEEVVANVQ